MKRPSTRALDLGGEATKLPTPTPGPVEASMMRMIEGELGPGTVNKEVVLGAMCLILARCLDDTQGQVNALVERLDVAGPNLEAFMLNNSRYTLLNLEGAAGGPPQQLWLDMARALDQITGRTGKADDRTVD